MVCIDTLIIRVIAKVEHLINEMLNQILHHSDFKSLEASWRGLYFLISNLPNLNSSKVQIKLLSINQSELQQDCGLKSDVEKTVLFNKIYTNEYDTPGGIPFAVLLFDFDLTLQGRVNWIAILSMLSKIAAASFSCLLMGVQANFFELSNYSELFDDVHVERCFSQSQYDGWHKCRLSEDMRFINLVLPRVMWRMPYDYNDRYSQNNSFTEQINSHDDYCWGSPCYLTATMIMQCFIKTGWFTEFKAQQLTLPMLYSPIDTQKASPLSRLEACMNDRLEQEIAGCGFMAVVEEPYVYSLVHRTGQSVQIPARYDSKIANMNEQIATLLPYMLCACRFAHYIKILARDKMGSLMNAAECEHYLQQWIFKYCGHVSENNSKQWSRYPLEEANIKVSESTSVPGKFLCEIEIKPNYHIEQINTKLRFTSLLNNSEATV